MTGLSQVFGRCWETAQDPGHILLDVRFHVRELQAALRVVDFPHFLPPLFFFVFCIGHRKVRRECQVRSPVIRTSLIQVVGLPVATAVVHCMASSSIHCSLSLCCTEKPCGWSANLVKSLLDLPHAAASNVRTTVMYCSRFVCRDPRPGDLLWSRSSPSSVPMDLSAALTADQAAVYDRQLRVWGLDVQNR